MLDEDSIGKNVLSEVRDLLAVATTDESIRDTVVPRSMAGFDSGVNVPRP